MDKYLFRILLILLVLSVLVSLVSHALAASTSFLCITSDTKEYIDVVSKGDNNEVLVQLNGGEFLDGKAEFDKPVLFVTVPVDGGVMMLAFNVASGSSYAMAKIGNEKQVHEMKCMFR